jgi:hypothetical protein
MLAMRVTVNSIEGVHHVLRERSRVRFIQGRDRRRRPRRQGRRIRLPDLTDELT